MKNNKLYSEIEKLNDRYKDSSYVDVNNELYQLTEDVAVKFAEWKDDNSWEMDYREQKTHTTKELFTYFLENIYKK